MSPPQSEERTVPRTHALTEAGLSVVDPLAGDWSCRSGHEAGLRLTDDDAMTAVFVVDDDMAIGLVWALHERGRRVPDEVSVVGMDDIPAAWFQQPALTTAYMTSTPWPPRESACCWRRSRPPAPWSASCTR
jgi:DNA-binding LacI/PurR family transcriptional regulator